MNLDNLFQESQIDPPHEDISDYIAEIEEYAEKEYKTELSYLIEYHELTLQDFTKKFVERVSPHAFVDDLMFIENGHKSRAYVTSLL
jgi:hypothetical protein